MAVLAECQHRHETGVDGFGDTLELRVEILQGPGERTEERDIGGALRTAVDRMDDDVSIKVAIWHFWLDEALPAFSLRRIHRPTTFLYELIVHPMTSADGEPLSILDIKHTCAPKTYKANLVAVKDHEVGHLAKGQTNLSASD